jgi:hypothetical protein
MHPDRTRREETMWSDIARAEWLQSHVQLGDFWAVTNTESASMLTEKRIPSREIFRHVNHKVQMAGCFNCCHATHAWKAATIRLKKPRVTAMITPYIVAISMYDSLLL